MRPDREGPPAVVRFEGHDVLGVSKSGRDNLSFTANGVASVEAQALFNIRQWALVEELTSVDERHAVDEPFKLSHHVRGDNHADAFRG